MSQQELQRLKVIENAVEGRLSAVEAAEMLGVSAGQVKRLKRDYNPSDAEWVRHGNRGREPANTIPAGIREKVRDLARGKYAGFNDRHLHEKVIRDEGLDLSRRHVASGGRELPRLAGTARPAADFDGSGGRRHRQGLSGSLSGRTRGQRGLSSPGPHSLFRAQPVPRIACSTHRWRIAESHGPFTGISTARGNATTNSGRCQEELAGKQFPTQVGRALEELGIEAIVARAPQAKGRIERTRHLS